MSKNRKIKIDTGEDVLLLRRSLGMNQSQFWSRLGVTQSGGSRYETGRNIPRPVQALLMIVYGSDGQSGKSVEALRSWRSKEGS